MPWSLERQYRLALGVESFRLCRIHGISCNVPNLGVDASKFVDLAAAASGQRSDFSGFRALRLCGDP